MILLELDFYQMISHSPPPHPRQYPESLRQPKTPPDIFQSPYRHLKIGHSLSATQWPIQDYWEKIKKPIKTILNVPSLQFQQVIWHDSESPKHPPNTFQTPFIYIQTPQNLFMLALWSALSGISYRSTPTGKGSNCIWFDFQLLFHQHSLGNIHDQSDTIQKPSRHHQAQCNHLSIQFVSSIHKTIWYSI